MLTAEKWYEGQKAYNRYGIDMQPARRREISASKSVMAAQRKVTGLSIADKKRILFLIIVAGILGIGIIIAGAYAATINYENNQIRDEINALQGEVESLEIEIHGVNNLAAIESKAKDMGMVYAQGSKYVVLSEKDVEKKENFAGMLKKEAYN